MGIKLETEKATVVRCPLSGRKQLLKECVSCGLGQLERDSPDGEIWCGYDNYLREQAIDYLNSLSEEEVYDLLEGEVLL